MPSRTRPARLSACALALILAACGGGGDRVAGPGGPPAGRGSFSGAVAGGVSRTLGGAAYYGRRPAAPNGEAGLILAMGALEPGRAFRDGVLITRRNGALPAAGTHPFHDASSGHNPAPDAFSIAAFVDEPNGETLFCLGTAGALTVRSAAGGRGRGSYTAQAECFDPDDPADDLAVTLAGAFEAVDYGGVLDPRPAARRPPRAATARR